MGIPPSITVKAGARTGNSSTFTPGLTAGTGYVYFSCNTDAPKASCAINTNDSLNTYVVNTSAATPESVTVTVTTTANTGMGNVTSPISFSDPRFNWLPLTIGAFFLLSVLLSARRVRRVAPTYSGVLLAGLILIGAATPSCGGGEGGTQITPPPNNGTPPGSYTVTVYAFTESNTGNGANSSADSNVAIPLTVN
jgi:hypothetical protein